MRRYRNTHTVSQQALLEEYIEDLEDLCEEYEDDLPDEFCETFEDILKDLKKLTKRMRDSLKDRK